VNNWEEPEHAAGLVFVALMFIGAGIGLLFNRPDVGGAIGMGLGFLAMAFIRLKKIVVESETKVSIGKAASFIILSLIGVLFILGGIALLLNIVYIMKYAGAAAAIAIGLIFLALAFKLVIK